MKKLTVIWCAALIWGCAVHGRSVEQVHSHYAPLVGCDYGTRVAGEYIVVLHENTEHVQMQKHLADAKELMIMQNLRESGNVLSEYSFVKFKGYLAKMDNNVRDRIRKMADVKYVECNRIMKMEGYWAEHRTCITQNPPSWGLSRTSQRDKPWLYDEYKYIDSASGQGVDVYVLDTGIMIQHPNFENRAKPGVDCTVSSSSCVSTPSEDKSGHGTHVAGTIMSKSYGIAKKAQAISVKISHNDNDGNVGQILNGLKWVYLNYDPKKKNVASMSIGTATTSSINEAAEDLINLNIVFVTAAGNDAKDACTKSPGSCKRCITVAASDRNDIFYSESNYGSCVDIIAPGVDIVSTSNSGGFEEMTGTSMAAPHVSGVVAKYLSSLSHIPTHDAVRKWLLEDNPTEGKIHQVPNNTPNKLVYMAC